MSKKNPLILVADTDGHYRNEKERMLRARGFQVVLMDEASEILEFAEQHHPDLIITTLLLSGNSGLNGGDVCAALRRGDATRDIRLVIHTGADLRPEDMQYFIAQGADGVLPKSESLDGLYSVICELLRT
ncbi:MAG: integral rane sensor hybrid histidine kinase [Parcubacteria group bacterium]|nr:integral rane sensor hybrid histidine kinase [Parcubacteria group bacterium]